MFFVFLEKRKNTETPQKYGQPAKKIRKSRKILKIFIPVTGKRPTGRPQLRYKDTCKHDLKALGISTNTWEAAASGRSTWKQLEAKNGLSLFEAEEKRSRRMTQLHAERPATTFTC